MEENNSNENQIQEIENQPENTNPITDKNIDEVCNQKKPYKNKTHALLNILGFALLFIGLIILYILHFTQNNETDNLAKYISKSNTSIMLTVNNDSIIKHFTLAELLKKDLETEAMKYQQELTNKKASFEEKYKNYQINVQSNILTQTQMQNAEKQLQKEAETLQILQEQYSQTLALKEMSVQKEITDSIVNAARRVNDKKYKADYVLATSTGSAILYANEVYDITKYVIEELNNAYKKSSQ
ncbi:MAG: OmpH family outer membrane protein [Bacteroidales bacterium]|nr:OmpH family outer membrane protein [Bacteroidales bacterium]MDD4209776.1 OmpH family outer membrane protein [Bacteroidales bacterium]